MSREKFSYGDVEKIKGLEEFQVSNSRIMD